MTGVRTKREQDRDGGHLVLDSRRQASGAIAYVGKEHLSAERIRDLWELRHSDTFVSV